MTAHPSSTVLERFSAEDLAGAARQETAAHVERCASCRAYLEELALARDARLASVPPDRFIGLVAERRDRAAGLAHRRRRRYVMGGTSALLAAAAALVLIARPGPEIRLKGTGVAVHRSRAGAVRVLGEGDTIRVGDALRLVVTLPRRSAVAAWFVDQNGRVDGLLSSGAVVLPAGEQPLPGSVTVEAPCVDSQVVVAVGRAANGDTEAALRRALVSGLPPQGGWQPPGTLARSLRCE
jgi:hypothetical protein